MKVKINPETKIKKIKKRQNKIRELSNNSSDFIKNIIGNYYGLLHIILIIFGAIIILFSNNIFSLCALLFVVSLDAFAIIVRHDCPLTQMEEKYLGISGKRQINKYFKSCGIAYKCNHLYESQIEFVINVWALIACKIVIILFCKMCNIELKG